MQNYGSNFYVKLQDIASSLGVDASDIIGLIASESGGNTSVVNNIGAVGLFQFVPSTLKDLGFTGNSKDFAKLSGEEQIGFFKKFADYLKKINGGKFKTGAALYAAHFLPACLMLPGVRSGNLEAVIAELHPEIIKVGPSTFSKKYYDVGLHFSPETEASWVKTNPGFSTNGKITLGNINNVLQQKKNSEAAKQIMNSIGMKSSNKPSLEHTYKPMSDNVDSELLSPIIRTVMEDALESAAAYQKLPEHSFIVKIAANDFATSIEFARILSMAYDEVLYANAETYVDGEFVEVCCNINGPKYTCFAAAKELTRAVKDEFIKQCNINNLEFRFEEDKKTNFKELDIKTAEIEYRKFLIKSMRNK